MNGQTTQLWNNLLQAGLVQGEAPESNTLESPWYVKVLLAFSGWLAAIFLLGFIGLAFQSILDSAMASLITGGLMLTAAYLILRTANNEFFQHLALAISFAAQVLIAIALLKDADYERVMPWVLVTLLQLVLAFLMPNFTHRVSSAYFAAFAFSIILTLLHVPYLYSAVIMFIAAWLWLNEFNYPAYMQHIRALGYGVVLALIQFKGSVLFGFGATMGWRLSTNQSGLWLQPWMGDVLATLVVLYVIWRLLQRAGRGISERFSIVALLGGVLISAVSFAAQGVSVAMILMMLGFAGSNRVLLGLAISSLLFYISSYYYLLDATLLVKAQVLLILGIVLLAARQLLHSVLWKGREAQGE